MKKLLFLGALLMQAAMASAQYSIEVEPFTTKPGVTTDDGQTMNIIINYGEEEQANMAQFNITLPAGMTFDEGAFELDEERFPEYKVGRKMVQPFAVSYNEQADGSTIVVVKTDEDYFFTGSTGVALYAYFLTDENMPEGEYEIKIDRGVLAIPTAAGGGPSGLTSVTKIAVSSTDAIRNITIDAENQKVYTVGGQRVASKNLKKGIYVVDGKKVTVK
ncbi:MAG: hypothetical protein J6Z14_07320 [Prevotella sp.]|nr:hypothetical protein [Prevotella sp.]